MQEKGLGCENPQLEKELCHQSPTSGLVFLENNVHVKGKAIKVMLNILQARLQQYEN